MLAERMRTKAAPPRRRGKRSNARGSGSRRGSARASARQRSEEVRQRRMDLAGLACLAMAVYLGYVVYLGWNGGAVGNGA